MRINSVLIKSVLTEKATQMAHLKIYAFEVNPDANKTQVSDALEKLYKIKVKSVKVITRIGKVRRSGKRMIPKKLSNRKIVYVSVKEGKIDLFPQA